jgi:hypothetical protein
METAAASTGGQRRRRRRAAVAAGCGEEKEPVIVILDRAGVNRVRDISPTPPPSSRTVGVEPGVLGGDRWMIEIPRTH